MWWNRKWNRKRKAQTIEPPSPPAPAPDSAENLLDQAANGDSVTRQSALAELVRRAENSHSVDDWNSAALAFFQSKRFDDAISVWDQLLQADPANDLFRLNLATAYSQVSQVELCRFHLRHLSAHASTTGMRDTAREQLENYESLLGLGPEDQQLRLLQTEALREAVASEDRHPQDYVRLARIYVRAAQLEGPNTLRDEAAHLLESGWTLFPNDASIMELLVALYLTNDPKERLPIVLRALEQTAPNSPVFEAIIDSHRDAETSSWVNQMQQRTGQLLQKASDTDPAVRRAAVTELERIVAQYPANHSYRMNYAFALMLDGDYELSLEQATILDQVNSQSHEFHFNLGQIFWGSGDATGGRRHLDLAVEYAQNEQERHDAWERISDLQRR